MFELLNTTAPIHVLIAAEIFYLFVGLFIVLFASWIKDVLEERGII